MLRGPKRHLWCHAWHQSCKLRKQDTTVSCPNFGMKCFFMMHQVRLNTFVTSFTHPVSGCNELLWVILCRCFSIWYSTPAPLLYRKTRLQILCDARHGPLILTPLNVDTWEASAVSWTERSFTYKYHFPVFIAPQQMVCLHSSAYFTFLLELGN